MLSLTLGPTVVGATERDTASVNVRNRDDAGQKTRADITVPLEQLIQQLTSLKSERRAENTLL